MSAAATIGTNSSLKQDAFNTPIQKGDLIAFAVRKGSDMWMNKLVVEEVTTKGVRGYDPNVVTRRFKTLTQMKTVVILGRA